MLKPIIQGNVAWQDLYDQGYVVIRKDEYEGHWPQALKWETMDTAPQDGIWILGWNGRWMEIVFFACGKWDTGTDGALNPQPTHWIPMPNPPQKEKKQK